MHLFWGLYTLLSCQEAVFAVAGLAIWHLLVLISFEGVGKFRYLCYILIGRLLVVLCIYRFCIMAHACRLWQDQASKDRALQALSSMSSAQIVSATALQPPVPGSGTGTSVLPSVLYPHMSQIGTQYLPYVSSGVSNSLQVMWTVHGIAFRMPTVYRCIWCDMLCVVLGLVYKLAWTNFLKSILDLGPPPSQSCAVDASNFGFVRCYKQLSIYQSICPWQWLSIPSNWPNQSPRVVVFELQKSSPTRDGQEEEEETQEAKEVASARDGLCCQIIIQTSLGPSYTVDPCRPSPTLDGLPCNNWLL